MTLFHLLMRVNNSQIGICIKEKCLMPCLPLSSTLTTGPGTLEALHWKMVVEGMIKSQLAPNLFKTCCASWMCTSLWSLVEFIPE